MKKFKIICPILGLNIQSGFFINSGLSSIDLKKEFNVREKQLINGIELADGINIRRINAEDIKFFQSRVWSIPSKLSSKMYILEKTIRSDDRFETSKKMFNIILAFRLLRGGYISNSGVYYFLATEDNDYQYSGAAFSEQPRKPEHIDSYALNWDEISPLKNLIDRIQQAKIDERKHFHLAIKRFEHSYEAIDVGDNLIDLMIAFEILFLKGKAMRVPVGVVIGVGCSMLLGETDKEREEIYQVLSKAYSIRNTIVHGGEYHEPIKIDKEYSIYELVDTIENYLRETIKKLL